MIADKTIKRPALRYYGGKWNLAPWIISYFPPHKNYVEPCGGAASVLLQKPRSPLETYNDLDGNVVNFFRVLRDNPDELIRKIRLTPWAREEYNIAFSKTDDPVENARRFYSLLWMAMGGSPSTDRGSWRYVCEYNANPMQLYHDDLIRISQRFDGVQIENISSCDVISRYDNSNTLFYFDPPYVTNERNHKEEYVFEWSDSEHSEAAALLRQCAGSVIVSGYACPLYAKLYEDHGWKRVDRMSQTNSGGKRVESLWINPKAWAVQQQPTLFEGK